MYPAIDGPTYKRGDCLRLIRLLSKSAEGQEKLNKVKDAPGIMVIGTRVTKRFPAVFDHENNDYIQMVTINIADGVPIEFSASHFELIVEGTPA